MVDYFASSVKVMKQICFNNIAELNPKLKQIQFHIGLLFHELLNNDYIVWDIKIVIIEWSKHISNPFFSKVKLTWKFVLNKLNINKSVFVDKKIKNKNHKRIHKK